MQHLSHDLRSFQANSLRRLEMVCRIDLAGLRKLKTNPRLLAEAAELWIMTKSSESQHLETSPPRTHHMQFEGFLGHLWVYIV